MPCQIFSSNFLGCSFVYNSHEHYSNSDRSGDCLLFSYFIVCTGAPKTGKAKLESTCSHAGPLLVLKTKNLQNLTKYVACQSLSEHIKTRNFLRQLISSFIQKIPSKNHKDPPNLSTPRFLNRFGQSFEGKKIRIQIKIKNSKTSKKDLNCDSETGVFWPAQRIVISMESVIYDDW